MSLTCKSARELTRIITCFHLVVEFMTFIMIFASFCVYNSKHAFFFPVGEVASGKEGSGEICHQ